MVPDQTPIHEPQGRGHSRIETQIHRRKKAEAFSALELEWDRIDHLPPSHLRMPSGFMAPTLPDKRKSLIDGAL
jgi:hypothetical protein